MANLGRRSVAFLAKKRRRTRHIFHWNVNTALRSTLFRAKCSLSDVTLLLRLFVEIPIEQWLHSRHLATRTR